jgi:hypothetical protein
VITMLVCVIALLLGLLSGPPKDQPDLSNVQGKVGQPIITEEPNVEPPAPAGRPELLREIGHRSRATKNGHRLSGSRPPVVTLTRRVALTTRSASSRRRAPDVGLAWPRMVRASDGLASGPKTGAPT